MSVFLKSSEFHIGYSNNKEERYKASSGGIGTAIVKHLLQTDYGTSLTFVFDKDKCMYVPKIIHSDSEINVCGSIYQDIDIYRFIKDNVNEIRNGMVVICPPCQVSAIRSFLGKQNIKNFIISFSCSGQTTIEGTWCYYRFLGIDKRNIENMQYRGNGWPSGIQILTKDGQHIYKRNWSEPWNTIHQSLLFRPIKCIYCKRDTAWNADISLADPWLETYKQKDKIGNTLIITNSEYGATVIKELSESAKITLVPSSYDEYAIAQRPNIEKKLRVLRQRKYLDFVRILMSNRLYYKYTIKSIGNMRMHIKLIGKLRLFLTKHDSHMITERYMNKIINHFRSRFYGSKLGKVGNKFHVTGKIELNNPQCVSVGNNVGIGKGSFLGPVIQYAGIQYRPQIIIGDGTLVGKNCSIAAINRVEIGKHVLFAGYVHITDHSHGYEDIVRPIAPQRLSCKGPVIIEDDCWLGFNCEILSGTHIGKHSVIGARSVVTKDVPPYSIVAGNPARVIKQYNFDTKKWERKK